VCVGDLLLFFVYMLFYYPSFISVSLKLGSTWYDELLVLMRSLVTPTVCMIQIRVQIASIASNLTVYIKAQAQEAIVLHRDQNTR